MQCFVVWNNEIEGRLDADFYKPEFRKHLTTLSGICFKELGEMVEFSNETWDQKSIYNDKFPYIEISEVDITSGEIRNIIYYEKEKAPSRAKMIVREDDIIVSTTRPHRGAISLIDESKNSYIASTGFAVLRGLKTDNASRDFLFHILKTSLCLNQMLQRSSGGNYPAITTEDLKKIKIPLPPLPIQNQIVDIMQSAYTQKKQKEKEAQRLFDSIDGYVLDELGIKLPEVEDKMCFVIWSDEVASRLAPLYYSKDVFSFLDKFTYGVKQIMDVSHFLKTGFAAGKQEQSEDQADGIIQIRPTNIDDRGQLYFDKNIYLKKEYIETKKDDIIQKGEVLFNNTNSQDLVGKTAYFDLEGSYFCSNHVTRIKVKENAIISQFLKIIFNLYQKEKVFFNICTNWNNQSGVNIELLKTIPIPLPPLSIQNKIAEEVKSRISEAERLKAEANKIIEEAKKTVEDIILLKD